MSYVRKYRPKVLTPNKAMLPKLGALDGGSNLGSRSNLDSQSNLDWKSFVNHAGKIPIEEAVAEIKANHGHDIKPGTIRRWCREGCPHEKGGRGRGHATLVSVDEVLAWLAASQDQRQAIELANGVPDWIAKAIFNCWRDAEGMDKRRLAGILTAGWYAASTAVLDAMREKNSAVPDISSLPAEIQHLQKIARGV